MHSEGQDTAPAACYIHDMPTEILVFILNGSARSPRHASEAVGTLPLRGDAEDDWIDRPLLDGRWRFAARAVCRTWRRIIQHPSPSDAAALDAYRPFAAHSTMWRRRCPKWATGRIVCLTAAADVVAVNSSRWAREPEAVFDWCRTHAGATRKQTIAVLVASGVPCAVDAVVDHHWPLISFSDHRQHPSDETADGEEHTSGPVCGAHGGQAGTADPPTATPQKQRPAGWGVDLSEHIPAEYTGSALGAGWRDEDGDVAEFLWALLAIALRRGLHDTFCTIKRRFACRVPDHSAALEAAVGNQPDLFATLVCGSAQEIDDMLWNACAQAGDPSCLVRLLELAAPPAPDLWSAVADWVMVAVVCDRPCVFGLLDARGVEFNAAEVARVAAQCGSRGVLAYVVARDRRLARASPETDGRLDMAVLAKQAMTDGVYASGIDGIRWLCDVAGYAPRPGTGDLRRLVEHACACDEDNEYSSGAEQIVYVAERWPRAFAALPRSTIRGAFGHCVRRHARASDAPARLVRALDAGTDPANRDVVIRDVDLWSVVASNLQAQVKNTFGAGSLFVALCQMARGERPRARDMGDTCDRREPCHCTKDPFWRHQNDPIGGARDPTTTTTTTTTGDKDAPCSDAALELWAPLRRWCAARPVRVSAIFPGWTAPAHDPAPPYSLDAMDDLHKLRLIARINALGFLLRD